MISAGNTRLALKRCCIYNIMRNVDKTDTLRYSLGTLV